MANPSDVDRLLSSVSEEVCEEFESGRRILSFAEYVQRVFEQPEWHARSVAQYIRDTFEHFGSYIVETPYGELRRFRLFDGMPGGTHYLIGQEEAQNAIYRSLTNFVRQGQVNQLLLLHGPNGSAKSSLIGCIAHALELYSETPEGARYRLNWIFPAETASDSNIGFGDAQKSLSRLPSYAHLEDTEVNAKIVDETRDCPLLILPEDKRRRLLEQAFGDHGIAVYEAYSGNGALERATDDGKRRFQLSRYIGRGNLCDKNKRIFEALLASYHGDFGEVLKHVQVERFYVSRRYRAGLATVGPAMRVDAAQRQITTDRTLAALPASLQNVTLYEPFGDLVDGNRGIVEFNDFLKRPMDLNRYLLGTSETAEVPLEHATLFLDAMLIATVNETYLEAFKAQPDWASYKGRIELVRMPYLRDYKAEQRIYQVQLQDLELDKPVAPHVDELAALWAVLTRLVKPEGERYPEIVRTVLTGMAPLDKARLYAEGKLPDGLTAEESRELRALIPDLYSEGTAGNLYEGRIGSSAREMKTVLLNAAHGDHPCFSPLALIEELGVLVEDPSLYQFLQIEPEAGYHDAKGFIEVVTKVYLDMVDNEVRSAMGLVEEGQYDHLFTRYVNHVKHWLSGEKIFNATNSTYQEPDERVMAEVEDQLGLGGEETPSADDRSSFRKDIISAIGAFRVENPDAPMEYHRIFAREYETLERRFFDERREAIQKIKMNLLRFFDGDVADLAPAEREQVERTLHLLKERFGYVEATAREAIGFLVRQRYEANS